MMHPSPVVTFARANARIMESNPACLHAGFRTELGAAVRFAVVVATAVVVGSVAAFSLGLSLVQADVVATDAQVVVAAFMPAFFGAWTFFLLRRSAWRSPARAFVVGGTVTGLGVFAHDRVLHSRFYEATAFDLPSAWLHGVVDGVVAPAPLADTGLMPVYAVTVVGVGVLATALQRLVTATRIRR